MLPVSRVDTKPSPREQSASLLLQGAQGTHDIMRTGDRNLTYCDEDLEITECHLDGTVLPGRINQAKHRGHAVRQRGDFVLNL